MREEMILGSQVNQIVSIVRAAERSRLDMVSLGNCWRR